MKWLRPRRPLRPCPKRRDCISPAGHWGPCQLKRPGGGMFFVDEHGNEISTERTAPLTKRERERIEHSDPTRW